MVHLVHDLTAALVAAEPSCETTRVGVSTCALGGTSVAVLVAALVGGGWVLAEIVGALRARRLRKMAEGSDTPV